MSVGALGKLRDQVRAVIQRVSRARVIVDSRVVGEIQAGAVIFLGVGRADNLRAAAYLAEKIANMRIFNDDAGKMNLSLLEIKGSALVISQFTLYADKQAGRRPSFLPAAPPELANQLYESFVASLRSLGLSVQTGVFQAHMAVELVNDGPVTILLDSEKTI